MALSYYERKARLKHGVLKDIAKDAGCSVGQASRVLSGARRDRRIERLIARRLRDPVTGAGVSVAEAFGEEHRKPTLEPETA